MEVVLTVIKSFGALFQMQIKKDWGIIKKTMDFSSFFGKTFCNISK